MSLETPLVAICIATRNRKAELRRALESCFVQDYGNVEVRVYDDASGDGTSEMVKSEFPAVQLFTAEHHVERTILRNRAIAESQGPYLVSLDDDCYFTDRQAVTELVQVMEMYNEAAVIAVPLIEPFRSRPSDFPWTTLNRGDALSSFLGGACMMRTDRVRDVGGYRTCLVGELEERDLSLRILDHGGQIIYAGTDPLIHTYSTRRSNSRQMLYAVRNAALIIFLNAPILLVVPLVAVSWLKLLVYKFSFHTLPVKLRGVAMGCAACFRYRGERIPVCMKTYLAYRRLPKHGPCNPADYAHLTEKTESLNSA